MGLEHNLNLKGWNSQVHRGFPRKSESSNVSRDNVSREIGRIAEELLAVFGLPREETRGGGADQSIIIVIIIIIIISSYCCY